MDEEENQYVRELHKWWDSLKKRTVEVLVHKLA